MATRADRLNERLRGAQRVNVDDDDTFGLDIPGIGEAPVAIEPPATSTLPARSNRLNERLRGAQRVNVNDDDTFSFDVQGPGAAPIVAEEAASRTTPGVTNRRSLSRSSRERSFEKRSTRHRSGTASSLADVPEEASPALVSAASTRPRRISASVTSSPANQVFLPSDPQNISFEDEVEASPIDAPGSGRRRTRMSSGPASGLSARLQDVLGESQEPSDLSSPSTRAAKRKSSASVLPAQPARASARGPSLRRETRPDEEDELSPDRPRDAQPEEEEAEEIDAVQAAKSIGRKRPRRSLSRQSPEIGAESSKAEQEAQEHEEAHPKRRKGRSPKSPSVQKQHSKAKAANTTGKTSRRASQDAAKLAARTKPAPKQRKRRVAVEDGNDEVAETADNDNAAIEITVHRFVNLKKRSGADDDDEDPLHSEIPFANRSGESTVDVFAQVCEEVINNTMGQFHELLNHSGADSSKKKEFRIKMRAIEAYKEELNSRLLQHAIHLDHWYSLRKRVRHVQKEKLTLREEILKLRAEREQVALRMDAIRTKHEADTKESTYRLGASGLMYDIDLAVERGQKAPELTRKEQKEADLANLELLVAQITDQASSNSLPGGLLKQVTEFNGFLERAALALESR